MLSLLWCLPLALAAAATVAIWRAAGRLSEEAVAVRASTDELVRLRPLVAEVRAEIAAVGARSPSRGMQDLGPR